MSAFALARRLRPLAVYDALLAQDGIALPHGTISVETSGGPLPAPALNEKETEDIKL
jgi:hypothetical protein